MAESKAAFGVDLYRLEKVAKDHLPTVSLVYDNALGKAKAAEAALDGMSSVPEQFQGAGGPVSQAYGQMHGAVIGVLTSTRTSLDETATALHEAAMLYAENDQAAADKLHELIEERGKPRPELTP